MTLSGTDRLVTGWGRTAPSRARVRVVASVDDVRAEVAAAAAEPPARRRGVLARGLGRAYGDAAQNSGGALLDLSSLAEVRLDEAHGTVTAGAGASLDGILRVTLPRGWFLPVTPGTRQVTVGGAVAADVHGKNHHVDGTFGGHLTGLDLVAGDAALRSLRPTGPDREDTEAFWATVGGMGLTGVVTAATLRMVPVTSSWMRVDTERVDDLDDLMARMVARDADYRYSVAWVDGTARGGRLGRGILTRGDHAAADDLPRRARAHPLRFAPRTGVRVPATAPRGLLNRWTLTAFNTAWFHRAPARPVSELQSVTRFFHPLDGVGAWNRLYGPAGFVQYQLAVPDDAAALVPTVLARLRDIGAATALSVLKRFGPANPAPLSFPAPGWTLAVDVPAAVPGLGPTLTALDELVADAGGRLYLAKDSRVSRAVVARTYPRLSAWAATRDRLDPDRLFVSDLSRRLLT